VTLASICVGSGNTCNNPKIARLNYGDSNRKASSTTRDVHYTYDVQGRQLAAKFDSSASADGLASVYDVFGRLASSTISMGGFSKVLTALYDVRGRRERLIHPDNQAFTYVNDPADRLTGIYVRNGRSPNSTMQLPPRIPASLG